MVWTRLAAAVEFEKITELPLTVVVGMTFP